MSFETNIRKRLFTLSIASRHSLFVILRFYIKKTSSFAIRHSSFVIPYPVFCSFFILLFFLSPLPVGAEQTCMDSIISTASDTKFILNNDGTASDKTTGLMWMRCSLGQNWDGNTCDGSAAILSWADSLKAAVAHEFAGYSDWRLPNKNELESLVEGRCFSPAISETAFPATPPAYFWTSSPYAAVEEGAWSIDFGYGTVNASVKHGSVHIRLVRDVD